MVQFKKYISPTVFLFILTGGLCDKASGGVSTASPTTHQQQQNLNHAHTHSQLWRATFHLFLLQEEAMIPNENLELESGGVFWF